MKKLVQFAALAALALVFAAAVFAACALPTTSSSGSKAAGISGVPNGVNNFLTQSDIDKLTAAGMKIYRGNTPPTVNGTYDANSEVITYDDNGQKGQDLAEYHYTFYDQAPDGSLKESYSNVAGTDTGTALGAFISGEAQCFSVFLNMTGDDSGCNYEMPAIYSGCLTAQGIQGFALGFITTKKSGSNCDALVPIGNVRVITESDGMADKTAS